MGGRRGQRIGAHAPDHHLAGAVRQHGHARSLAVTADQARRAGAGVPLPFDDPAQDEERAVAGLLPPLTVTDEQLVHGLDTLDTAVASVAGVWTPAA